MPYKKRIFDLVVSILASVIWIPATLVTAILILLTSGWPIFYISSRRVHQNKSMRVVKFRTMVKNAAQIANRETIPATDTQFLNIPIKSRLYTRLGRLIERICFTELPQIIHVIRGSMSLVGNRPLPENVIEAIKKDVPYAELRFATPCGLTGPVQLVGREQITDAERIRLEVAYCQLCQDDYSMRLDFLILLYTVLLPFKIVQALKPDEVIAIMEKYSSKTNTNYEEV
jgi:lipopolysaccharide/colanic/teichoic acid biosynthesis glycosyltransferase